MLSDFRLHLLEAVKLVLLPLLTDSTHRLTRWVVALLGLVIRQKTVSGEEKDDNRKNNNWISSCSRTKNRCCNCISILLYNDSTISTCTRATNKGSSYPSCCDCCLKGKNHGEKSRTKNKYQLEGTPARPEMEPFSGYYRFNVPSAKKLSQFAYI
jgi:hypothetical protein